MVFVSLLLPRPEPIIPPSIAANAQKYISEGREFTLVRCPARPEMEFKRIKAADTAAVCFVPAHPMNRIRGVRKIPPPTPTVPESSPIPAPAIIANGTGTGLDTFTIAIPLC